MKAMIFVLVAPAAHALAGCSQMSDTGEEGLTSEAANALCIENSLSTNAIDLNGVLSNGIDLNGLDPDLLSPSALAAIQDPGEFGENSRLLYRYVVGCAYDATQSLSFTWTDSLGVVHPEVYWGSLGLSPSWKYTSITPNVRRAVSACIAARANYYGTPVTISMRGPEEAIKHADATELAAFPMEEGTFWGDLFDGAPQLYACHNDANRAHSRTKLRECAAGHLGENNEITGCAHITIVGNCDAVCDPLNSTNFYRPRCYDSELGAMTNDVVTVFLPQ